jgi:hypothetical protein
MAYCSRGIGSGIGEKEIRLSSSRRESDTAKEYRNRAEELRATAERMTDKESRKTLISIAAVYDCCAAMVEGTVKKAAASLPKNLN